MKKLELILCVLAISGVFHFSSFGQAARTYPLPESFKIRTAEAAVTRALQYTGFDKGSGFTLKEATEMAHLVAVQDTTNEFLKEQLTDRTVWSVTFDEVILGSEESVHNIEALPARNFQVLIDPETGDMLKVTSQTADYNPDLFFTGKWKDVKENQVPWEGVTISTPGAPPVFSLREALLLASQKGGFPTGAKANDPARAKAIVAYCLSYTWSGEKPRPSLFAHLPDSVRYIVVWYIVFKDYRVEGQLDTLRDSSQLQDRRMNCYEINATTGQVIGIGSVGGEPGRKRLLKRD
jgi:hypothetical protein